VRANEPQYASWGCEYCADPNNHLYGHLDQILDSDDGVVLLRCPLCRSAYQPSDSGIDVFLRLTAEQAETVLPASVWQIVRGDA
jgi:hypothetical protein